MPEKISKEVLVNGIKEKDLSLLETWGKHLAPKDKFDQNALTTSQIRKVFGEIKRIQADFGKSKGEILLLDPKIAYAVGRSGQGNKIRDFYTLLSDLIKDINEDEKKFKNFVNVVEAVVAYHKAAGGQ